MTAPPDDATRNQIAAADPDASTWLSANAGSGKTRVLTDRVARLLLRGVAPERILCLTYTKAAAREMQNRLFERLGAWAMMENAALGANLRELGVAEFETHPEALRRARSLFAEAIETPGGLKIQTIHSFCASLLRRFPLEADVSPAFTEMDERAGKILRQDILADIASSQPDVMAGLAHSFTGEDVDSLLQEITRNAEHFAATLDPVAFSTAMGLGAVPIDALDPVDVAFNGTERDLVARCGPVLATQSATMVTLAEQLANLNFDAPSDADLAVVMGRFLFTDGGLKRPEAKLGSIPTVKASKALGADLPAFQAFMERVAQARDAQLAKAAFAKTKALHDVAAAFLPRLAAHKQARGWLDFDDLIVRARALLSDAGVAAWVLFRLDGGIDHILVDEAQDTSPAQWDVVRLLAQEFTAGQGARADINRTIFVVGDQKQSIYSFQGADPAAFERMRGHFARALEATDRALSRQDLLYSFRSAKPVLDLVDACFTDDLRAGMGDQIKHHAFKAALPGRVDLWPWIDGEGSSEANFDKKWYDPVDTVGEDHHHRRLADRIAGFLDMQLRQGQITQVGKQGPVTRAITPGDFLILVQSRSGLFHEIIRACKKLNLPMAGADRLRIGGELGVKDLTALLKYLATPEDDLSLAAVLRSPLVGYSEAQLYDLAYGRESYLRAALEARKEEHATLYDMLRDLRDQSDFLRPYELLERILTRYRGRENLAARLGPEAEEGVTALLDQALHYEQTDVPSLTGFLEYLATDEVTIKRQIDAGSDQIRVMTVHGAKGLEAPIVIMPDTGETRNLVRDDILHVDGQPIWAMSSSQMPRAQRHETQQIKQRQQQERMRLLYVAMTRAESWLVVCGAGKPPKDDSGHWYPLVQAGLRACGAREDGAGSLRLSHLKWPVDTPRAGSDPPTDGRALPKWLSDAPPPFVRREAALSPSQLPGAKALPGFGHGLSEQDAKARGTAIHLLLEHLPNHPRARWPEIAAHLLRDYDTPAGAAPLDIASRVLSSPELEMLFSPGNLAEVAITALLPELGGRQINGTIDRLCITKSKILAVDFKSNAVVPDTPQAVPAGILRQLGAYSAALAQIYPDKTIETAILWTETAQLMTVRHDIVRAMLQSNHIS